MYKSIFAQALWNGVNIHCSCSTTTANFWIAMRCHNWSHSSFHDNRDCGRMKNNFIVYANGTNIYYCLYYLTMIDRIYWKKIILNNGCISGNIVWWGGGGSGARGDISVHLVVDNVICCIVSIPFFFHFTYTFNEIFLCLCRNASAFHQNMYELENV